MTKFELSLQLAVLPTLLRVALWIVFIVRGAFVRRPALLVRRCESLRHVGARVNAGHFIEAEVVGQVENERATSALDLSVVLPALKAAVVLVVF